MKVQATPLVKPWMAVREDVQRDSLSKVSECNLCSQTESNCYSVNSFKSGVAMSHQFVSNKNYYQPSVSSLHLIKAHIATHKSWIWWLASSCILAQIVWDAPWDHSKSQHFPGEALLPHTSHCFILSTPLKFSAYCLVGRELVFTRSILCCSLKLVTSNTDHIQDHSL